MEPVGKPLKIIIQNGGLSTLATLATLKSFDYGYKSIKEV